MKDTTSFLVVCGMPRCGTRQFTDFLNRDDRICLQGEINRLLIPDLHKLLLKAEVLYSSKNEKFKDKRNDIVTGLFSLFSLSRPKIKTGARVHGFKTPNIELYHKQLSAIISPAFDRLLYFYCIRNIIDCYLSYSAMQFAMTPDQFISRYIASLKAARKIRVQSKRKNSSIAIQILNLDDFIATSEKSDWIVTKLYKPLGLKLNMKRANKYVVTTENRNATVKATGKKREKKLAEDIQPLFSSNKDSINLAIEEFNNEFGENLGFVRTP